MLPGRTSQTTTTTTTTAAATTTHPVAAEPVLAQPSPYAVNLEAGRDYFYCSCGLSKNQPFCDGSHKGTGLAPTKFQVAESKTYYLCGCKVSANKPFCDGTHSKEKGIRKYNEFLLKKNNELKVELDKTTKSAASVMAVSVGFGLLAGLAFGLAHRVLFNK
eukprot:jgi/Hompol1/6930/HPOL_005141-RA